MTDDGLKILDEINRADEVELLHIAKRLFHGLWGMDKESVHYDKPKWCGLQVALNRLGVKI